MSSGSRTKTTTDHEEIRRWVEERGGKPACVKGTGSGADPGMLRIEFPGRGSDDKLSPIEWDAWFKQFDENGLALLYQDERDGYFNKIIARSTADAREHGDHHASVHHGREHAHHKR